MTEEVKPNPSEATTHDAQLAAENMASGEEKVQKVDLDADYEASKAFSVSEVDRKGGGAEALKLLQLLSSKYLKRQR
jgi:methylphosphotriester-DNA--protein-cysteine methyltransferase